MLSILTLFIQIDYDKKVQDVSIKIKNDFVDYCLVEKKINGKLWYHNIKHFIISYEYSLNTNKMDKRTFSSFIATKVLKSVVIFILESMVSFYYKKLIRTLR